MPTFVLWRHIIDFEEHNLGGQQWNIKSFFGWLAGVHVATILSGLLLPAGTSIFQDTMLSERTELQVFAAMTGLFSIVISWLVTKAIFALTRLLLNENPTHARSIAFLALLAPLDALLIFNGASMRSNISIPSSTLAAYFLAAEGLSIMSLLPVAWFTLYRTHSYHWGGGVTKVTDTPFTTLSFSSFMWIAGVTFGGAFIPQQPASLFFYYSIVMLGSLHMISLLLEGNVVPRPELLESSLYKFRVHQRIVGYLMVYMLALYVIQGVLYITSPLYLNKI
ncbi:hypothetical protein DL96DRAFT_1812861 [Flagelloscypha sp. PMI_526]|nr:hypothetical protein DL96DRAFT_1812861 [Flagelloscypha sp. PMI_526]